jgi:hypothetical protein
MGGGGWSLVVGVFAVAWALTFAANLGGGSDGGLYPMTSYPMFSTRAPTNVTDYQVQADGDTALRVPLALAFDDERALRPSLVSPVARKIATLPDCTTPACEDDLAALVDGMRPVLQARLGLAEAPGHLQLVVVTRSLSDPSAVSEVAVELA